MTDVFNFVRHELVEATEYVIPNWPTELAVSDFGMDVYIGATLEFAPTNNPTRETYRCLFRMEFEFRLNLYSIGPTISPGCARGRMPNAAMASRGVFSAT